MGTRVIPATTRTGCRAMSRRTHTAPTVFWSFGLKSAVAGTGCEHLRWHLRFRLQSVPAHGCATDPGLRLHVRRNCVGVAVHSGIGGVALLIVAVAMTAYSGSLSLQMLGVRVRRSVSQVIVTLLGFGLILWLY